MTQVPSEFIRQATHGGEIDHVQKLQSLWSGYGELLRIGLANCETPSVILKRIKLPDTAWHPRGWNSPRSHQRKLSSYQIEAHWYQNYAYRCGPACFVPNCLAVSKSNTEIYLLLSDLKEQGFPEVRSSIDIASVQTCLSWLAHFHATFLGCTPSGLWQTGTYWHLNTRPDELENLSDKQLKRAAGAIDAELNGCRFKTLVHGDAKLANFCFAKQETTEDQLKVAAVDFQYIGGGVGIKDVAYFLGSCLSDTECETREVQLLDHYFATLSRALNVLHPLLDSTIIEREWRNLYDVAWADFHRFLKGWSPGHWKINSYSEKLTRRVVDRLL